ncbi:MAG: hypothetical protein ACRD2E_06460 [Terriglobales bacterium]
MFSRLYVRPRLSRYLAPVLALPLLFLLAPNAQAQTAKNSPSALGALKFRELGPAVAGGRVSSVVGIPGNPMVYYVGTAGGGVWKSVDGGYTWKAIFKHGPNSIGAVALAPSNPNLVWVGTGEANIRSDVINGHGVYFSPDGGATWQFMGLKNAGQISSILVNPQNANEVWVGVFGHTWGPNHTRGVYRTEDGGHTWQRVLFVNDATGVASLIMEPGNPRVLLAAMWQAVRHPWGFDDGGLGGGIYRSTDGGTTWAKLTHGVPKGPLGRIGLAAAPSDPQRIYALIEAKHGRLWVSNDLGGHWKNVNNNHAIDDRPWYFSTMAVAPNDPDRVYFLASSLHETQDGGRTIESIGRNVHADNHSIWIDPDNPNRIIEGNDGGVDLSLDAGRNWRFLADLPIEQFYQVATDNKIAFDVCGGLQDNNAWCGPSRSGYRIDGSEWFIVAGGDGQYAVPAPSDPDIIYADSQNGYIGRINLKNNTSRYERPTILGVSAMAPADLKYRFNWTAPIAVAPTDPNTVYLGANVLFKTSDGGLHWTPISPDLTRNDKAKQQTSGGAMEHDISGAETYDTILSFGISPKDPRTIWVGTDDGLVQVTRDGGAHWTNVTANIPGLPQWGRVQQIDPAPSNPAGCYVSFDFHETGNDHAYVYKTSDYGQTWTNISAGLPPDTPVKVVREDPDQAGFLVAGTNTGLFYSQDDGASWKPLQANLPTITVYDLQFVPRDHSLVVATHGRGIFVLDNITPLEDQTPAILADDFHLFPALPAYMLTSRPRRTLSLSNFTTPNPPTGVMVDYYVKTAVQPTAEQKQRHQQPVQITITDAQGHLVDTMFGPAKKGFNRINWPMRYAGATPLDFIKHVSGGYFGFRGMGPEVAPGTYKITATLKGQSQAVTAEVKPDPNFPVNMANFRAETRAALRARGNLSALNAMLNRLTALHAQLAAVVKLLQPSRPTGVVSVEYQPVLARAQALDKKVVAMKAAVYNTKVQPGSEDDIHYLADFHDLMSRAMYSLSDGYDLPPNQNALALLAKEQTELHAYLGQFNGLLRTDVASFNRLALHHHASTLFAGAPIATPETGSGM